MCSRCREPKATTAFSSNKSAKDGLGHYCKVCVAARNAVEYASNRDGILKAKRDWAKAHPAKSRKWHADNRERDAVRSRLRAASPTGRAKRLLHAATTRSKMRKHAPPALHVEDLLPVLENGLCQITGLPFVWVSEKKGVPHPMSPSLDRPDSSKPYSRSNFRIVCWAVNVGCATWGLETTLAIWGAALGVSNRPT